MLNEPSLAILIDCWTIPSDTNLHTNITDYLSTNPAISAVVLASYNCKQEFSHNKSIWYTNHHMMFNADTAPRKIRELYHVHRMHLVRDTAFKIEHTHPTILDYVDSSRSQIAMLWPWQLEYYLLLNPTIKNVYVFGAAWDICVKKRPLGYAALVEIADINIFTHVKCVENAPNQHPNLDLDPDWVKVSEDTYQYILGNKKVDG